MSMSVDSAFSEFMKNTVNLDSEVVKSARQSRDNLLNNIAEFDNIDGFFDLYETFNLHFGSFARKTKCRDLDDIDLLIGISANSATYNQNDVWNSVSMIASSNNAAQIRCQNNDGTLNSTLVLNRFKEKLQCVREYNRSEINRKGEAIVLNLKSKEWSFDIVPCFHTVKESDGRDYYLIPNGMGKWKKTEPKIEQNRITNLNKIFEGKVLSTIRLIKYWNKRAKMPTVASYILETIILDFFDTIEDTSDYIDIRFRDALHFIKEHIFGNISDSKLIEGNINTLSLEDQIKIYLRAGSDYIKACNAIDAETKDLDHRKSINIWREILGEDLPRYG